MLSQYFAYGIFGAWYVVEPDFLETRENLCFLHDYIRSMKIQFTYLSNSYHTVIHEI